jgi:hypothetical protein
MISDVMDWNECKRNFIRNVEIDDNRIKSLIKKALQRLERARKTEVSIENVSFIVEDYYEVIKELLICYLLKNGLRSKNHQCLISYFYKNNSHLESEVILISQMSYFRNRLEYYGEDIPYDFYTKNKDNFEKVIDIILKIIEN